jgi:hypothetical protein
VVVGEDYEGEAMIKYYYDIEQNSEPWLKLKRGVLTASNICKILTPAKLEISRSTGYLYEFCRQRVDDMPYGDFSTRHTDRGHIEESLALQIYEAKFGGLKRCGFVENTKHGFKIGCSPDALVGDDGGVQVKSFTPNVQFGNIVEDKIEGCHMLQIQMELFVTERQWWDVVYQSSGTHQIVTRVYPDEAKQARIKEACADFYSRVEIAMQEYRRKIADETRFIPTPPVDGLYNQSVEEMHL